MGFKIYIDNEIIGYSELECGDPAMGVAFAILCATEAYNNYQQIFIDRDFEKIERLNLYAIAEDGIKFEPVGGVAILDYSMEIGEEEIEVSLLGLHWEIYQKYFPHHIEADENHFKCNYESQN